MQQEGKGQTGSGHSQKRNGHSGLLMKFWQRRPVRWEGAACESLRGNTTKPPLPCAAPFFPHLISAHHPRIPSFLSTTSTHAPSAPLSLFNCSTLYPLASHLSKFLPLLLVRPQVKPDTMSNEEKARTSGEVQRAEPQQQSLPTINPQTEKPELTKPSLHPAVYIVYVGARHLRFSRTLGG